MAITIGSQLGSYEITALLGKGGFGEVYRAKDKKLKREVAIKILPEEFSSNHDRLTRFQREAEVLASLNHPNIAAIYDLVAQDQSQFLVLELVDGETLADRIARGPIPLEEALNIAKQIAEALEAAHEKGVIHRDLKPGNIMLTSDGKVKVLDFGLAKALEGQTATNLSNSPTLVSAMSNPGVILGTASYMSPEQAKGKNVDKRADIWAFGVVFYEMLTGQTLFSAETVSETMAAVMMKEPDWNTLPANVPARLLDLLQRCLTKEPRNRLRDIGEARVALENPAVEVPTAQSNGLRHGRLAWGLAAVFLAIAALVSFIHFREEPARVVRFFIPPPEKGTFQPNTPMGVSPDGRRVVFQAAFDGKWGMWVRDLDNPVPHLLATISGSPGIPFWAPDSRRLAFFDGSKLKAVDVTTGGAVTTIIDDGANQPGSGSWNQDEVIVYSRLTTPLFQVSAAGGSPTPLTQLDKGRGEFSHWAPWFLPDGRHFLFNAYGEGVSGVYVGDLASKTSKLVVALSTRAIYVNPGYLLFVREGTLLAQPFNVTRLETTGDAVPVAEHVDTFPLPGGLALGHFSASDNGVLVYTSGLSGYDVQLAWYDRMGNKLGSAGALGELPDWSLSPDDARVVFIRRDPETPRTDLWIRDFARGSESRLTTSGNDVAPVWSGDGTQIYFRSNREGTFGVYRKNANNAGSEELVEAANKTPADASRDGRYLITLTVESNPKTGIDIFVLPLFGDRKPFPYVQTEFAESRPRLSPGGQWLAYQSNLSRTLEVYVESFPQKGPRWQVSTKGGRFPVWRHDGRELYYYSPDNEIMAVDVKASVSATEESPFGVPRKLFGAHLSTTNPRFDVSEDGRFLLAIPVGQQEASPMTVVLNWPELLKKK
jgi:serine/threonine protein kinase/Tol biopolymer transport system component